MLREHGSVVVVVVAGGDHRCRELVTGWFVHGQPAESWIDELEDVTCQEKESKVELACKFSNPKARVSWYKNKLEVFQGLKYKLSNEDGVFRLFINNAAMEDAGKYTCQANNLETSCYLTVEG